MLGAHGPPGIGPLRTGKPVGLWSQGCLSAPARAATCGHTRLVLNSVDMRIQPTLASDTFCLICPADANFLLKIMGDNLLVYAWNSEKQLRVLCMLSTMRRNWQIKKLNLIISVIMCIYRDLTVRVNKMFSICRRLWFSRPLQQVFQQINMRSFHWRSVVDKFPSGGTPVFLFQYHFHDVLCIFTLSQQRAFQLLNHHHIFPLLTRPPRGYWGLRRC